eukprot:COSAG01_NODE_1521_length_10036_cov_7.897957_2_plen_165_part_00
MPAGPPAHSYSLIATLRLQLLDAWLAGACLAAAGCLLLPVGWLLPAGGLKGHWQRISRLSGITLKSLVCAQQLPDCGSRKYGIPPLIFINTPSFSRAALATSDPIILLFVRTHIVPGAPGKALSSWSRVACEMRPRDMTVSARGASPSRERTSFLRASLPVSQI